MRSSGSGWLLLLPLLFSLTWAQNDWGPVDYEIFDLHDQLIALSGPEANFYNVLELEPDATLQDINKAYRKQSIALHPDKNPDAEAQKLYTLLTSISTILKDDQTRQIYDGHLYRGIPKWRGTGYYYNRYKPGLPFVCFFLAAVLSFAEMTSSWISYLQQTWMKTDAEESLSNLTSTQLKKHLKKAGIDSPQIGKKNINPADAIKLLKKAGYLHDPAAHAQRPSIWNLSVIRFPIWLLFTLPVQVYSTLTQPRIKKDETSDTESEVNESRESLISKKRRHVKNQHRNSFQYDVSVGMSRTSSSSSSSSIFQQERVQNPFGQSTETTETNEEKEEKEEKEEELKTGEWQHDEIVKLAQLMNKFPAGIPGRWVKIAMLLKRSVEETAEKAREVMENPLKYRE